MDIHFSYIFTVCNYALYILVDIEQYKYMYIIHFKKFFFYLQPVFPEKS